MPGSMEELVMQLGNADQAEKESQTLALRKEISANANGPSLMAEPHNICNSLNGKICVDFVILLFRTRQ
jgi:hypothetical protein